MKITPIPIDGMIEFDASGDEPTFNVDVGKLAERLDGGEVTPPTPSSYATTEQVYQACIARLAAANARIAELEARLKEAREILSIEGVDAAWSQSLSVAELAQRLRDGYLAQLKEAEGKRDAWFNRCQEVMAQLDNQSYLFMKLELNKAEARAEAAEKVLRKVEAYMGSEEGPIYRHWENLEICDYEEDQFDWEPTLEQVRDVKIPLTIIGHGTEWPSLVLYREILAALSGEGEKE